MASARAIPAPTPETAHFWQGAREGALFLQRCRPCARPYFPPRPFCPHCGSRDVEVFRASGRATLYSFTIHHRAMPGFEAPYAIAVVALLLVTGVGNALLILGMPLNLSSLTTPWAQLMALKLIAFAAMLGLAALNRFRFAPALATPDPQSDSHLRHSLRVEFGLALVILSLVAWIGLLSPIEG